MKSNKKAFPFMSLFIGAAAALLVMVPVRIYQYLKIIEPETGFYSAQNFSVYIIYAVMLFSVIFSLTRQKSMPALSCLRVSALLQTRCQALLILWIFTANTAIIQL